MAGNFHKKINGDRKQVTVLFADIVRSSDIIRTLDSEAAENIFNQVIAQQIAITQKFSGTVNQVMGDGIMCLFGAEPPYEDHVLRAVSAGQEMLRSVTEVQKKNRHVRLQIRVGINTGEVILNKPRSDHYHASFQITGETVHMTDRILKRAQGNQMLVSQSSKDFLEKYYSFKKIGNLAWHPTATPVDIFDLKTLKPSQSLRTKKQPDSFMPRPLFENRMTALLASAEKRKEPKIVWLYGAPGVGKTSLLNHFIRKQHQNTADKTIHFNFYPDAISDRHMSFEQGVIDVLGMPGSDPICSSDNIRHKAECLARHILAAAATKRILLVLEDIHWAKEDFLLYLEELVRLYQGHEQLWILATSRKSSPLSKSASNNKVKEILLDPMNLEESRKLLQKLDKDKTFTPALKNDICRLSAGNPYFIHEYFQWVQTSAAMGESYSDIRKKLDQYTPGQIADALYNKLAAAGKEFTQIAKISAVFGMRIPLDLLEAVSGQDRKELLASLARLEAENIVKKDRLFPHPEWVFTHELLQKVIYRSIPRLARMEWHAHVIKHLKKPAFKNIDDRYLLMAVHADRAENPVLQYVYSKWAARKERAESRHKSSLDLSAAARRALTRIPNLKNITRHDIKSRLFEISGLFITGKYFHVQRHIEELLKKKPALKKAGYLEQVLSFKELYFWVKGDLQGAARIARAILSLGQDKEVYVRENSRLGNLYIDMGEYEKAISHDLKVVEAVRAPDAARKFGLLVQAKPASCSSLALAYAELGDHLRSEAYFRRAYDFIENNGDAFTAIFVLIYLAHSLMVRDKNAEAAVLLKKAFDYCEKINASLLRPYTLSAYGLALARTGKKEEGLRFCRDALKVAEQNKLVLRTSQFSVWYAEALLEKGDYDTAARHLKQAITTASGRHEKSIVATAHYLMASYYLAKPGKNKKRALSHLHLASQMAEKCHMRALLKKIDRVMQDTSVVTRLYASL